MADGLISRQAAMDSIIDLLEIEWGYEGIREDVQCIFNELTPVDAVPVVRCKDCKYLENAECYCPYMFMSDGAHYYPAANDFCSYGERREENG